MAANGKTGGTTGWVTFIAHFRVLYLSWLIFFSLVRRMEPQMPGCTLSKRVTERLVHGLQDQTTNHHGFRWTLGRSRE